MLALSRRNNLIGQATLDIGCGTGIGAQILRETGVSHTVDGVDSSPAMAHIARRNGRYENVYTGDALKMCTLTGKRYALVVAGGDSINYFSRVRLRRLLSSIYGVLDSQGRVALDALDADALRVKPTYTEVPSKRGLTSICTRTVGAKLQTNINFRDKKKLLGTEVHLQHIHSISLLNSLLFQCGFFVEDIIKYESTSGETRIKKFCVLAKARRRE